MIFISWFNLYGLVSVIILLIPTVILSILHREIFVNSWKNKIFEMLEQISRFACLFFMIYNIPGVTFGFWFNNSFTIYLWGNGILLMIYCLVWLFCFNKQNLASTLVLSVVPTLLFLFDGIIVFSIPLLVFSCIFGICHITISCKNFLARKDNHS